MENWIPDPLTLMVGREFARISFMGPFLRLSVFAEDDVSLFVFSCQAKLNSFLLSLA